LFQQVSAEPSPPQDSNFAKGSQELQQQPQKPPKTTRPIIINSKTINNQYPLKK